MEKMSFSTIRAPDAIKIYLERKAADGTLGALDRPPQISNLSVAEAVGVTWTETGRKNWEG